MTDWKIITAKKVSTCGVCGENFPVGTSIYWKYPKQVRCLKDSPTGGEAASGAVSKQSVIEPGISQALDAPKQVKELHIEDLVVGVAGNSARAQYNKKAEAMKNYRVRLLGPKIGNFANRFLSEGVDAENWKKGAEGEEGVAQALERMALRYGWYLLHDCSIPKSQANIDHIAVTDRGCFIIDAKNRSGKVEIDYPGTILTPKPPILRIGGRKETKMLGDMKRNVARVEKILRDAQIAIPVFGMLAFYDANFPLLMKPELINGVLINGKGIENSILSKPLLDTPSLKLIHELLTRNFPPKKVN